MQVWSNGEQNLDATLRIVQLLISWTTIRVKYKAIFSNQGVFDLMINIIDVKYSFFKTLYFLQMERDCRPTTKGRMTTNEAVLFTCKPSSAPVDATAASRGKCILKKARYSRVQKFFSSP